MPEHASWPIAARSQLREAIQHGLARRPARAQLLTGIGGTGKSTLLAAIVAEARAAGRRIVPVTGAAPFARVPLGALAPALAALSADAELGLSTDQRLQLVLDRVGRDPESHLVVVDDAHQLDELSSATVYQLVRVFGVASLIAARSGERLPEAMERLRRDDLVSEHPVPGLRPDEIAEVLERHLGASAAPDTIDALWRRTDGNPLFVRGLVLRSLAAGAAERSPHGIRLALEDAGDVTELAERSLAALAAPSRRTAQLLALADGVRVDLLTPDDAAGLDGLRGARLVDAASDGTVRLPHPLFVEVARRSLDADPARAEVVDAAVRLLDADPDPLRRTSGVRLLLAAGGAVDANRLAAAAAVAHTVGDHDTVAELAPLAVAAGGDTAALRWDQGDSLSLLGRLDEADAAFAAGWRCSPTSELRALGIARHGEHLAFRRFDVGAALDLARRQTPDLPEELRVALEPELRIWRTLAGHRHEGDGALPRDAPPALLVRAAMAAVLGESMRGHPDAARESADALAAVEREFGTLDPQAAAAIHLEEFFRHLAAADGEAAWRSVARQRTGPVTDAVGMWTYTLGVFCSYDGRLAEGSRLAALAVDQLRWRDPTGLLGAALALRAVLAAAAGDAATARATVGLLRDEQTAEPRAAMLLAECRAWELYCSGRGDEAAEFLAGVAGGALDAGYGLVAALTASLGIRFGRAAVVLPVLERAVAAAAPGNRLIDALRSLAAGVVDGDGEGTLKAARTVAEAGMRPTARDALRHVLTRRRTLHGELRRRMLALAEQLEAGIDAPTLHPARRAASSADLPTARERAVADLAARRLSNDEIAAKLGISVRTVENHLSRFYAKTGTDRRTLRAGG